MAISVEEARAALVAAHSEAGDPERFSGERLAGGWRFSWAGEGPVPLGTSSWVVADNGAVGALSFRLTAAVALARLNAG